MCGNDRDYWGKKNYSIIIVFGIVFIQKANQVIYLLGTVHKIEFNRIASLTYQWKYHAL